MDYLKIFEDYFEVCGIGVRFAEEINAGGFKEVENVSFCEAVSSACRGPLILKKGNLSCPGSRFVFGVPNVNMAVLTNGLMQGRGITGKAAEKLIKNMPCLLQPFKWIVLGDKNSDIYIFYFNPKQMMKFLVVYQMEGDVLEIKLSSIMTMCGDIAARVYTTGNIRFSYGCIDSRKHGGIKDAELILGVPAKEIERLAKLIKIMI